MSARSGSGTTTACASATAASRCARGDCWKRCRIRGSRGSTPRTRRSGAPFDRCSSASTASASRPKHWPIAFRSRPRIPSASRSDFMVSTISAAPCRRTRSPRCAPTSPIRLRARPSSCSSCAIAAPSDSGMPRSPIGRRIVAAAPDNVEARGLLQSAERRAAAAPVAGRNDPCPCGSGRKFKQCHGSLSAAGSAAPAPPDPEAQVRAALAAHMKGDIDGAERGYRAVLAAAPENPLAMHYLGVVVVSASPARRSDSAPRAVRHRASAGTRVSQQSRTRAGRRGSPRGRDRRVSPHARRETRSRDRMEQPGTLAACGAPPAGRDRGVSRSGRAQDRTSRRRIGISRSHCWRTATFVPVGANTRGANRFPNSWAASGRRRVRAGTASCARALTLLVTAEQGLGDMLQFVRLAAPIARKGVRVLVSAPTSLVRLLATAPGVAHVFTPDDARPRFDAHAPILALANALEIDAATIPAAVPYITADAERCAQSRRPARAVREPPRVGLAWQGNRHNPNDRHRSVDASRALAAPGAAGSRVVLVAAGRGGCRGRDASGLGGTRAACPRATTSTAPRRSSPSSISSSASTRALPTSAGALAQPTWILLPFAPDWRWQTKRTDNPWYPTARLFRQPRIGAWDDVVRDVAAALTREP